MIESIDHVNLVVRDLAGMKRFYEKVLGLTVTKEVTISGPWVEDVVGLENVKANVVYLESAVGPRVELIEYVSPQGTRPDGLQISNTLGIRHLAFKVSDIDRVVAALTDAGIELMSPIHTVPDSQVTYDGGIRKRLVYFHDPEANLLEFCEYS
jgi:catechol 2,3-dioxygenase-like lactoylglutathione lyase family enzyme